MKGFIRFLKDLSIKQTVVLTGIGITLFLHLLEGVRTSLTTGNADPFVISISLWFAIALSTFIIILTIMIMWYIIRTLFRKTKEANRQRKHKVKVVSTPKTKKYKI